MPQKFVLYAWIFNQCKQNTDSYKTFLHGSCKTLMGLAQKGCQSRVECIPFISREIVFGGHNIVACYLVGQLFETKQYNICSILFRMMILKASVTMTAMMMTFAITTLISTIMTSLIHARMTSSTTIISTSLKFKTWLSTQILKMKTMTNVILTIAN